MRGREAASCRLWEAEGVLCCSTLPRPPSAGHTTDPSTATAAGHNGWKAVRAIELQRVAGGSAPPGGGEWWEASVEVPLDAVALDWVVTYYEHCDNNDRQDFKVGAWVK